MSGDASWLLRCIAASVQGLPHKVPRSTLHTFLLPVSPSFSVQTAKLSSIDWIQIHFPKDTLVCRAWQSAWIIGVLHQIQYAVKQG